MKIDLRNEQGAIVELEVRAPNPTADGVYSMTFSFPDGTVKVVTLDWHTLRALVRGLVGIL